MVDGARSFNYRLELGAGQAESHGIERDAQRRDDVSYNASSSVMSQ